MQNWRRFEIVAADILIVDDETDIRELIAGILLDEGFEARLAHNSDAAISEIEQRRPSLVILDIWLQGSKLDGLDLLLEIKKQHADLPVVIISGHGNIETAVSAIKRGAYDYIEKPFNADRLLHVVGRALEVNRLRKENEELKERTGLDLEFNGQSQTIRQLRQMLKKVGPTNSRVLINGPMGSGKEMAARALHGLSHRASASFVLLSAAAMTPEDFEEELFGVEPANDVPPRVGALEQAHGGTLFIDEVGEMPLETQSKILRVLMEQTFVRVGGTKKIKVDVRIISSSSRDLQLLISNQAFREDLFHRLSVIPISVPPLSDRREDIPELISHFAKHYSLNSGQAGKRFAADAIAALQTRNYPGNVRELRNSIERIMIVASGEDAEEITVGMLPADNAMQQGDGAQVGLGHLLALPLREAREAFERDYVAAQISRFGGNISRTALFIGMERSALHRKIKLLGMGARDEEATG
jgi:two-component system, NtrC family, nitrogen regulation response regulator NtrX